MTKRQSKKRLRKGSEANGNVGSVVCHNGKDCWSGVVAAADANRSGKPRELSIQHRGEWIDEE